MSRFISKDGAHTVETAVAAEAAELRRDGYTEQKPQIADSRNAEAAKPDAPKPTK